MTSLFGLCSTSTHHQSSSSLSITTKREHFMATNSHYKKIFLNSWHSQFSSGIEKSTSVVDNPKGNTRLWPTSTGTRSSDGENFSKVLPRK